MNKIFVTMAAMLMIAVSCTTKQIVAPLQYGEISVMLADEVSVDVVSKAFTQLTPEEAAEYNVSVFDAGESLQYGPVEYASFQTQRLPLGTYYVTAESCTETEAEMGNGMLRLAGRSADIVLSQENLSQTATVECSVANAMVTVAFDESVEGRFTDLKVVLSNSDASRTLTVNESDGQTEMYFNPTTLRYVISGTFTQNGKEVSVDRVQVLEARSNLKLVVKVNLENGQINMPVISVDTTLDTINVIEEEFNPYI